MHVCFAACLLDAFRDRPDLPPLSPYACIILLMVNHLFYTYAALALKPCALSVLSEF